MEVEFKAQIFLNKVKFSKYSVSNRSLFIIVPQFVSLIPFSN